MKKKKRAIRAYRPHPQPPRETLLERYGRAYLRLEGLEWDELAGPKPKGFDEAPNQVRFFIVQRPMRQLEAMLGETYLDFCRWVYDQHRSEEEWFSFQSSRWERGELTLGHRRNDVTGDRGSGFQLAFD